MVQRMTMAWVKWLGCAGLLLLLSGPVMAAEGVLEILAAGDVLLGGRMLEAPQAGELFGPLTRRRLEQADIFLWNCEIAGLSSVSKQNTFVFHADGLLFPQMAFANGRCLHRQQPCVRRAGRGRGQFDGGAGRRPYPPQRPA